MQARNYFSLNSSKISSDSSTVPDVFPAVVVCYINLCTGFRQDNGHLFESRQVGFRV